MPELRSVTCPLTSWSPDAVFLWFLGTAIAAVWFVFRDPNFDYRLLCIGALLPDAVDVWFGGARAFHSLTVSIGVLVVVVVASVGRKRWRKRALAIPIGMMLHLVFDGAFSNNQLFWWPVGGVAFDDESLPSVARGWVSVVLELIGVLILVWVWRKFGLRSTIRRHRFLRAGALEPVARRS